MSLIEHLCLDGLLDHLFINVLGVGMKSLVGYQNKKVKSGISSVG